MIIIFKYTGIAASILLYILICLIKNIFSKKEIADQLQTPN